MLDRGNLTASFDASRTSTHGPFHVDYARKGRGLDLDPCLRIALEHHHRINWARRSSHHLRFHDTRIPTSRNVTMVLGRLLHYAGDALLVSTVLAGIKRQTGLRPDIDRITEPTTKGLLEKYLGFGEFVFDSGVAAARASSLFQKDLADRLQSRPAA